jgi:biofilm PGA synthesis N-glycosyltransferase PgaC
MIVILLAGILCMLMYVTWIIYICTGFRITASVKQEEKKVSVSVIVPFRNEEKNICTLLHALSLQDYPKDLFKVILVNDHSLDGSVERAEQFIMQKKINNFFLLHAVQEGKKQALTAGIQHSESELILTTDADCTMHASWITVMTEHYLTSRASFFAGPVMINSGDGLVKCMQQADYMAMQVCGLASLKRGRPLLCSGANLAFTAAAFATVNGYNGNENTPSGDDTFLMLKVYSESGNLHSVIDQRAIVYTAPVNNFTELIQQRIRWGSKVRFYKSAYIKTVALLLAVTNFLYAAFFFLLFSRYMIVSLAAVILKLTADYFVLRKGVQFFGAENKMPFLLLLLLFPFFFLLTGIASIKGNYEWKGRRHNS